MKRKQNKQEQILKTTADNLSKTLNYDEEELFNELKISQLSDPSSREKRVVEFGTNKRSVTKFHFVKEYLESLFEPFNALLIIIGIAELLIWGFDFTNGKTRGSTEKLLELVSALIIFLMVILASVVDFIQEYMAFKNSAELIKLITNDVFLVDKEITSTAEVDENLLINHVKKVADTSLTIGDLVYLKTGDIIPADMKIIWTDNLYVDQSNLTGESEPVHKSSEANKTHDIFSATNFLISDTKIVQGKVLGLVLTVADQTYASKIISFSEETNDETDYELGLRKVTKIILFLVLGFFPIVFAISGAKTGQWVSSLIFAISMVVSLIPESLPAILSSNLQVGSKKMAKEEIVIKNFKSVQNLGSTTTIATDKTGTLTTGKLALVDFINLNFERDDEVLKQSYLSVYFQNNLANQIDDSINTYWKTKVKNFYFTNYSLVESLEFDFKTRLTSVLLKEEGKLVQITKGAPKEVLQKAVIDANKKAAIEKYVSDLEVKGLKPILVAKKTGVEKIVETELEVLGILVFENQVKKGIKEVIKIFDKYYLDLKILTGDSGDISKKTGTDIGLKNINTITGEEFSKLDHQAKLSAVKHYGIFAKLNPIEKSEIVGDLKANKEVVTYLGDGINDVPALKHADVGISVNNGSATAKAASDVILLKKDLRILETGILEGRKIFTNAIKFIKIVVAMNFGLLVTILIGSMWFKFNTMSPIQLLLQNLFYDFMNLAFVFDKVDEDYIRKPQSWNPKSVLFFGLYNGIVPIIISMTNFLVVGYGFGLFNNITTTSGDLQLQYIQQFQTAFFLESLTTHILLVIVYRTDQIAVIKSRPSLTLSLVLLGFLGLGFFLAYTPKVNETLGYRPVANNYWLFAYFGYFFLTYGLGELSKWSYKKIFHQWI